MKDLGPTLPHLTLYADGRLLSWNPEQDDLTIRTLTESGITAFMAELDSSGYLAESHNVPIEPVTGVEPPGPFEPGLGLDWFALSPPDGPRIAVNTIPVEDPSRFAPSAERAALTALAVKLIAANWLPPDAWVTAPPTRYQADAYLLLSGDVPFPPDMPICPGGGGSPACARDVDTVAWPVVIPPDGIGVPFTPADGGQHSVDRCAVVGPAFADALAAAMQPGGLAGHLYVTTSIAWRAQNSFYDLRLRPLLPEESATCAGKNMFPVEGPMI